MGPTCYSESHRKCPHVLNKARSSLSPSEGCAHSEPALLGHKHSGNYTMCIMTPSWHCRKSCHPPRARPARGVTVTSRVLRLLPQAKPALASASGYATKGSPERAALSCHLCRTNLVLGSVFGVRSPWTGSTQKSFSMVSKCLLQRFTKEATRKKTLHQAGAVTNGGQQAELCQRPSPALSPTCRSTHQQAPEEIHYLLGLTPHLHQPHSQTSSWAPSKSS